MSSQTSENIFIKTITEVASGDNSDITTPLIDDDPIIIPDKKKRGRKKKVVVDVSESSVMDINNEVSGTSLSVPEEKTIKKRGRKPKGGKLIIKSPENSIDEPAIANVILHLKCSMTDLNEYNEEISRQNMNHLEYNPIVPPEIKTYNNEMGEMLYEFENDDEKSDVNPKDFSGENDIAYKYSLKHTNNTSESLCVTCGIDKHALYNKNASGTIDNDFNDENNTGDDSPSMREISIKLRRLKLNLFKNTLSDKKSACFWCTCDFDNPECYIPKYELDDTIFGYGSFCRPECAVAYLMKESIDDSAKFERYHLLNRIYSKVYNFKKNIKPAPNPYYILDKFYGNLSIQEYRKLLKSEHMLLVVDKPLTRILPELHEDTEDFLLSINSGKNPRRIVPSGTSSGQMIYKVKRQSDKQVGPSKSSIMREQFGV
jgi:hypothetical protein